MFTEAQTKICRRNQFIINNTNIYSIILCVPSMSILNAALADIRHMPYAQIINSNYVFFQCVVSEMSWINVKIYSTANTEMISLCNNPAMFVFVSTQFLILHPHCYSCAKGWWYVKCSYRVPYVITGMTNSDLKNWLG